MTTPDADNFLPDGSQRNDDGRGEVRGMTMERADSARPRAVTVAVLLTYLSAVLALVSVVLVLGNAGASADDFLRDHPDRSRTFALAGSYVFAGFVAVISVLLVVAGRALQRGRRWAWVLLLVITGLGLMSVISAPSLRGVLYLVPDAALLVCLLVPSTRTFVSDHARGSKRLDTSPQPYADN